MIDVDRLIGQLGLNILVVIPAIFRCLEIYRCNPICEVAVLITIEGAITSKVLVHVLSIGNSEL